MVYKISKFVKKFKIGNTACLYNVLSQEVLFTDIFFARNLANNLKHKNLELFKLMKGLKFIVLEKQDDRILQKITDKKNEYDSNYSLLRILMTDKCNLNCKYCKVENNILDKSSVAISTEDIIDSLKLFQKTSPKIKKLVSITGGEPLLFPDKVKEIIQLSQAYLDNYWIILFTNATLATKEITDYLKKNDVLIVISLDGIENTHNKLRVFKNGKGSYQKVMQGYQILKNKGCKIGFSCTVGTHNLDTLIKEMEYIIKYLKPHSLGINQLKYPSYKTTDSKYLPKPRKYVEVLFELYKEAAKRGIFVEQIYRKISPFVEKKFKYYDCGACGKNINLDAKGNLGPCKSFLILKMIYQNTKDELDEEIFGKLLNRSTLYNKKCLKCEALGICGGGCAYESFVEAGNYNEISERTCIISKSLLDQLLEYLYEINKINIASGIKKNGFYYINNANRRKIYGKIKTEPGTLAYSVGHLT